MRMYNMDVSLLKLKKWELLFWFSLALSGIVYIGYAVYAISYTPEQRQILLNQLGGVYRSEDLNKTNVSEGEVKQFAYRSIRSAFNYNYINFRTKSNYKKLLNGDDSSDMPDHRDVLSSYFGEDVKVKLVKSLEESPWSSRFHAQRRQVQSTFLSPPEKITSDGFYLSTDNRLKIDYQGRFFVNVFADGEKTNRFRVDYTVTLERKPLLINKRERDYYFPPMVPRNTFEWRVSGFDWKADRST
jgi:hypothetical protein